MVKRKSRIRLALLLIGSIGVVGLPHAAYAASCESIIGQWVWFTGGVVTINANGTFVQQSGNAGMWECTDAARGAVTFRWRAGGFVNRLALSADGQQLSSTDPSQSYVSAKRVSTGGAAQAAPEASRSALVLSTHPDGTRALPKELPELMRAATPRARQWRADAIPVAIEFQHRDAPNPAMRGPEVRLSFLSPSEGTGLNVTVTEGSARTFAHNQRVNWGTLALPPLFLDLPAAVRIARKNGMKGSVNRANLRIWSPPGAPPVLAWMVGDKTVNGTTGEIIDFDVTGYIARYNAQWDHAAQGLRTLMGSGRGAASPSESGGSQNPGNLLGIYNSTTSYSCAGNGGSWEDGECKPK